MSMVAFVASREVPLAVAYYRLYRMEPVLPDASLEVSDVVPIPEMTVRALFEQIAKKKAKEILIACHGFGGGLTMPLVQKVGTLGITETGILNENIANKLSDAAAAEQLSLSLRQFLPLKQALSALRGLALERVEIRACIVGTYDDTLRGLRSLFNAKKFCGPIKLDVFAVARPGRPAVNAADWNAWIDKHKPAHIDGTAPNRLAWDWSGTEFSCIAESAAAVRPWVISRIPDGYRFKGGPRIPLHAFMKGDDLVFPMDAEYRKQLRCVAS